jgi:glycosyltransferase involved in cell wall biosynthesis
MRIVYLLESGELFGGAKIIMMHAEALGRRGHRVTVVSPRPAPDWFPQRWARFDEVPFESSEELANADVCVATFFRTVRPALNRAGGPVFHLCQGYEGEITFYRDQWPEIAEIYRLPTRKLAISRTLAERLDALGYGPATDVGQAFDAALFSPGPPRPPSDPPTALVVGPLEIDFKGIEIALGGIREYRRRGGQIRLRRVSYFPAGDPERQFDVADEFHHRLDPERMPFAYRASDLFIGASRRAEGFGLPSLEALACGIPTLLSDVPGQKEIGGEAAWYFPDGNPIALADALPELLTDEARRRSRKLGPARAAAYDSARVAERLERAFAEALGTAG